MSRNTRICVILIKNNVSYINEHSDALRLNQTGKESFRNCIACKKKCLPLVVEQEEELGFQRCQIVNAKQPETIVTAI